MKLLTIQNYKTTKGESFGYLTGILYLSPHTISGVNICPGSSEGCRKACLFTAGRGAFNSVQEARLRKTKLFLKDRGTFFEQLDKDIKALSRKAERMGLKPAVRLNGTSDLNFLAGNLFKKYPDVQFYDYTKVFSRLLNFHARRRGQGWYKNYDITFSMHETNGMHAAQALELGFNVAVVFRGELPKKYLNRPVIDGDQHDLRFLESVKKGFGKVVGLTAKGRARKDLSGFVVDTY